MIEVAFVPKAEDYVAMQRAVFARQLRSRRFVGRMAGLLACALLVGMVLMFVMDGQVTMAAFTSLAIGISGGFAGLAIIIGTAWLLIPRRARRLFAQQRSLHHEQRFTLSDAGLRLQSVRSDSFYPWAELPGWLLSRHILLIFSNDIAAYYIPRRALDDEQVSRAVAILIAAGVPRR